MRIAIVGAGISGLVTARTLMDDGLEVTVLEKEDEVGGVWARARRYPGVATQNPRDTYAFSDFPMPATYPDWPSGEQVQAYLAAYADRHGVVPRVRLRTRVTEVTPRADGREGWRVRTTDADGRVEARDFDWLVVANGVFCAPSVPELPGRAAFEAAGGQVLHTSELHDTACAEGKQVVVAGFGKSAADVGAALAEKARSATLVYRHALWKMPQRFFGRVHLKYVLTTRFSESLFRWRKPRGIERVLHTAGRPVVWLFWRAIERHLRRTFALDRHGLVPDAPIERLVGCSLSLASNGFYDRVADGSLRTARGEVARFVDGGVKLADGTRIDAELVVFGTGFRQEAPFLPDWVQGRIRNADGDFRLHRNILPIDVPRLAFIGYNSSLYSQLTSEVGARWLAEHVHGRIALPSQHDMAGEIDARLAWMRAERAAGPASGTCLIPFNFHYINGLLRDMNARTWRTRNRLREALMPVDPSLYADLAEELRARRERLTPAREPALAREGRTPPERVTGG